MSLTKTNLIESIQNQINLPKTQSAAFVESILEIIKRTLSEKLVIKNWSLPHLVDTPKS